MAYVNLLVNAAHAIGEGHPEDNEVHVSTLTDRAGRAVVSIPSRGARSAERAIDSAEGNFVTDLLHPSSSEADTLV